MASRKGSTRRTSARPGASASGRVTPKGTKPAGARRPPAAPDPSGRYTPPTPKVDQPSPRWVPILMFTLIGLGVLTIVANYLGFLPGEADNRFLLLGLALITGGFVTATQYR